MGEKKKEDTTTAVFKVDMHCEGCANKIRKSVRKFQGVDRVIAEWEANKLTVSGKFDPSKLREKLADKTKKKIDIVSSTESKKDEKPAAGEKPEKKTEEKKPKDKEAPVTTATLKVELHCQGCIEKIYKVVSRTKGVEDMAIERQKDLVMVKGKMDVKALIQNLEEKLKRKVAVVVPKKEKDEDGGDKNHKNKSAGEPAQESGGGGGGGVTDGNRVDYAAAPIPGYGYGYGYGGFVGENLPSISPQMFSDENPNACSVM